MSLEQVHILNDHVVACPRIVEDQQNAEVQVNKVRLFNETDKIGDDGSVSLVDQIDVIL